MRLVILDISKLFKEIKLVGRPTIEDILVVAILVAADVSVAGILAVAGIFAIAGVPDFADVPAVSAFLLLRHPFFWYILIFDYHIWILLKGAQV